MPGLSDSAKMKTWILSIAKHTAIDYKRKQRSIPFLPEFFLQEKSKDMTLENHVVRQDDWEYLQDSLLKIKPHFRSLIILRGIKELSIKDTASILGVTELKVRVDYHRAIKQLQKQIEKLDERWQAIND